MLVHPLNTQNTHRFIKFSLVGGASTLLHTLVLFAMLYLFHTSTILANTGGFLTAFILSFLGHSKWTFAYTGKPLLAVCRFFCIALLAFIANLAMMHLLQEYSPATAPALRLLLSIGIMPFITYTLGRVWAFA
jgi:putative flippase GtrA